MGFEAKIVFVLPGTGTADQPGPKGETKCAIWRDANWELDFGHITRLEKLVGERFQHMRDSFHPFKRAGICVMHCFLNGCLFVDLEDQIVERCAPEILVPISFFGDDIGKEPTVKIGGQTYLDVYESRLKGRMGNDTLVEKHNRVVGNSEVLQRLFQGSEWHPMMDPPLLWASCSELANCLDNLEVKEDEVWKAIQYDLTSNAFFLSWQQSLRNLGAVGARAVFRFS